MTVITVITCNILIKTTSANPGEVFTTGGVTSARTALTEVSKINNSLIWN